jgi:hypothetical protein
MSIPGIGICSSIAIPSWIGNNFLRGEVRHANRVRHTPPEPLNAANRAYVQFNMKLGILPLLLSLALMVGCASEFQSTGAASSTADDSASDRSFHDMIDRMNEQIARDAANDAAQRQFLAGMAAAQQTMNHANDEFNQNGLH